MMNNHIICGYTAALVSCLAFGTFAVPIKCEAVRKVPVDAMVLQTYKIAMAFLTCWLALWVEPFSFSPWGLVSGLFMVPGGTAGYYAVQNAGLAVSQGIWSSLKVLVAFLWGIVIFHEPVQSKMGTVGAVVLLMVGLAGMSWFSGISASPTASSDDIEQPLIERGSQSFDNNDIVLWNDRLRISQRKAWGLVCACIDGAYGGSVLVPMHFAGAQATKGLSFLFSFAIGCSCVMAFAWLLRYLVVSYQEQSFTRGYGRLPSFHFDTVGPYAALAGTIWSLGNVCSIITVSFLGEGVGYSIVQSQLLIAGLWGVVYYNEIPRPGVWLGFGLVTVLGIVLLSRQHTEPIEEDMQ